MLYYRLFSYLVVLLLAFLLSFLFWKDQLVYWIALSSSLFVFLGIWFLVSAKVKSRKESFFYAFFGLLVVLSGIFLFILIENLILKLALMLAVVFSIYYYLNELFDQYFKKAIFQAEKLWFYLRINQIMVVFLAAAGFYGLMMFLNFSTVWIILAFLVLIFILSWYNDYQAWNLKISPFYLRLIVALVMFEVFTVISFLPFIYYLRGMLAAIFYFFVNESLHWYYNSARSARVLWTYLLFSLFLVLLILGTAAWF